MIETSLTWHGWQKIEEILKCCDGPISDNDKTLLLYGLLKSFCLDVYICIGQNFYTGERKTWVVEARKHM